MTWLVDAGHYVRGIRRTKDQKKVIHWGLDVAAPSLTPVRAVRAGKVIWVRPIRWYGKTVAVRHGEGDAAFSTFYAHLDKATVARGQEVVPGTMVGRVGRTLAGPDGEEPKLDKPMGCHLHWEVHPRPTPDLVMHVEREDPVVWLKKNGVDMTKST
jgi:murein DD-endopeptidase MepM/ murein hydrolase activator NlpD